MTRIKLSTLATALGKMGKFVANPRNITMYGTAQTVVESNQLPVAITMKLTKFGEL
jgi:hypothetical protein